MREARRRGKLLLPLVSDMQQKQMVGRGGRREEGGGRARGKEERGKEGAGWKPQRGQLEKRKKNRTTGGGNT